MSWSLSFIFLYFVTVQSMDLIHAHSSSFLSGFAVPEIDGSAVDDTCRIFFDTTPDTTTTTSPITRKQVAATIKKPAVQLPPKPNTKDTGAPIRTQSAAGSPITNGHSNPAVSLLYYLLANSRGQTGRLSIGRNSVASRRGKSTWRVGSFSSEDSSDES